MATAGKKSVLFICLGNICRSPIAEAVFSHVASEQGKVNEWNVDSAAIGDWHVGKSPDKRAQKCMKTHSIPMNHKARQITYDDFFKFDYIFGMDDSNMNDLKRLGPKQHPAKLHLLGEYHPEGKCIIRDPYYDDGDEGFEVVYQQCLECCIKFLESN